MTAFKHIIKTIAICAIVFSCSDISEETQESDKQQLEILKYEIEQLVDSSTCSENLDCDFIAFGSKPCGGPWSYLAYPTTIDVDLLLNKVNYYNEKERLFNIKWGIISDCAVVTPPTSLECIEGKCTAIYN
mgnify:FL=1